MVESKRAIELNLTRNMDMKKWIFIFGTIILLGILALSQSIDFDPNNPIVLSLESTFSPDGSIDCPSCVWKSIREIITALIVNLCLVWVMIFSEELKRKQVFIFGVVVFSMAIVLQYAYPWFPGSQIKRLLNSDFFIAILVWIVLILAQYSFKGEVLKGKWIYILGIIISMLTSMLRQYNDMYSTNPIVQLASKNYLKPDFVIGISMILILLKADHTLDVFQIQQYKLNTRLAYIFSFLFIISWYLWGNESAYNLFREDYLIEGLSVILFLCASIFFFLKFLKPGMLNRSIALLGAVVFLMIGLEEISWGQRIFGWSTPETWTNINYQEETNLHNLFNPIIRNLYLLINLIIGYALLSIEPLENYLSHFSWGKKIRPFLPSIEYSLFGFIFLYLSIQVTTGGFTGEITEIILALLGASLAIDIFLIKDKEQHLIVG